MRRVAEGILSFVQSADGQLRIRKIFLGVIDSPLMAKFEAHQIGPEDCHLGCFRPFEDLVSTA